MVFSKETRLRLCDANKKRLPFIKEQLRKKVPTPWSTLTEKDLNRYHTNTNTLLKSISYLLENVLFSRVYCNSSRSLHKRHTVSLNFDATQPPTIVRIFPILIACSVTFERHHKTRFISIEFFKLISEATNFDYYLIYVLMSAHANNFWDLYTMR